MADLSKRQFAQLAYTSFDNHSGRGGWQVKQVTGELTAAERETLTNRVTTLFDLDPELPDFPTEEQVLSRPARLCHGLLPDGSSVLWHTVAAGRDGSGRPGNVFAHVVVERAAGVAADPLPITRWRSVGWLRPYGAPAVAAAVLTETPPPPNPALTPDAAIAFVSASMQRQQLFRALIDAVAARLDGGSPIVLQVADHEDAVSWISSITHLLPPSAGRRLTWSTHDRPENAAAQIAAGLDLVCVPLTGSDVEVPGALVISAAELPDLALPGGAHRFAGGQELTATDLSELAEGVLADPDLAAQVVDRQAQIETELPDEPLAPVWTTAAAVLGVPDLAEFHAVARRAVARHHPATVHRVRWAADMVERAQLEHPPTASELLRRLSGPDPSTALATAYCRIVLTDGSWRSTPLAQVPSAPYADLGAIGDAVNQALGEIRAQAMTDPVGGLPPLLHLAEFLNRLGAPGEAKDDAECRLAEIVGLAELRPDPLLGDAADWPNPAAPVREINSAVLGALGRPTLFRAPPRSLRQCSLGAWLHLFTTPRRYANDGFLPAKPTAQDLAVYPYAVLALLADRAGEPALTPQQRTEIATAAIQTCLKSKLVTNDDCRELVADLLAQAPGTAVHVAGWTAHFPRRIAADSLRESVLYGAPNSELLTAAVGTSTETGDQAGLADLARLRLWMLDPQMIPPLQEYLDTVERALSLPGLGGSPPAADLLTALDAGILLAHVIGSAWPSRRHEVIDRLNQAFLDREAETINWLRQLIDLRVIDDRWFLGQAFLGYLDSVRDRCALDRWTVIATELLDPTGFASLTPHHLRDAAWQLVQYRSADDAEDFFHNYPRSADRWLRDHTPAGGWFGRPGNS